MFLLNRVPLLFSEVPQVLALLASGNEGLAVLSETSLVNSLAVFVNITPRAPKLYLLLRVPREGGDNLTGAMADVPGSYRGEVAKGIKQRHVCAAPGGKESFVGYTLVPGPATYVCPNNLY